MRPRAPRPAGEVRDHRRPGDALEHEIGSRDVVHLGDGIAAVAQVSHDRDLTLRYGAAAIAAQHACGIERVDVRVRATRYGRAGDHARVSGR